MAIHHYRAEDGIIGYVMGDLLIETRTGETSRVVRDGRGLVLTPAVADIAFDEAIEVASIGPRLAPLDVGFDLRAEGIPAALPADATLRVSYATRSGDRRVVSGPRAGVLRRLRAHGYRCQ